MGVGPTQAEWLGTRFRQGLVVIRQVTVRVRTPQFVVPLFAGRDSNRGVGINMVHKKKKKMYFSLFISLIDITFVRRPELQINGNVAVYAGYTLQQVYVVTIF